jgi:sugar phosphate permease
MEQVKALLVDAVAVLVMTTIQTIPMVVLLILLVKVLQVVHAPQLAQTIVVPLVEVELLQ